MTSRLIKDHPNTIATLAMLKKMQLGEPFAEYLEQIGDIDLDRPHRHDLLRVRAAGGALMRKLNEIVQIDPDASS